MGRKAIDNNRMRFCSGTAKFYPKKWSPTLNNRYTLWDHLFLYLFSLLCSRKYTARKLTQLHVFFTRGKILPSPAVVTCWNHVVTEINKASFSCFKFRRPFKYCEYCEVEALYYSIKVGTCRHGICFEKTNIHEYRFSWQSMWRNM